MVMTLATIFAVASLDRRRYRYYALGSGGVTGNKKNISLRNFSFQKTFNFKGTIFNYINISGGIFCRCYTSIR